MDDRYRRNPAVGSSHPKGRNPHPSRPFAAVVAKGSFGWRWAEGFSAEASSQPLQPEKPPCCPPQCVPCRNLGNAVSNQPGSQ